MWSLKAAKLVLLLSTVALVLTGCASDQEISQEPAETTPAAETVNVDGDYAIDVSLVSDLVMVDGPQQAILVYLRVQNSFYPVKLDSNETVLKLRLDRPSGEGYIKAVRIALYDGNAPLNRGQVKKLVFGPVEISAGESIRTGINEIDYFGNGNVDIIVELKVVPPELPSNDEEAVDYLRDLAADGSLNFSYEVTMNRGENRQIFEKVEIQLPEAVFDGTPVFYKTFYL